LLSAEREDRHELVLRSFFEAAAKMPLEREDAPTSLNLALKTRQVALRELGRHAHNFCGLDSELDVEDAQNVPSRMTPELAMNARDALHALATCEPLLVKLHNSTCGDASPDELDDDGGPLRLQLQRRFPTLGERALNRLYQRARQRKRRLITEVRRRTRNSASQIRDYLDLLGQEDL
jgi:hypothetical protein